MDNTTNETLTTRVNAYKVIARDSLRMQLISPRLTRIAELEKDLVDLNKDITDTNHRVVVENYEISVLDQNHPDFEAHKTKKEDRVKVLAESLTDMAKEIEEVNKAIVDQKDGITKIENGETKVSLDALNDLVEKFITTASREEIKLA